MFGAINFLPLYQQTVQGASATNSGLLLLPMMLGAMVVSVLAGQVITRTGRYKIFPILGGIGMSLGLLLLARLGLTTSTLTLALYMIVFGLGMGFLMQTTMLIAQNSVSQRDLGVASSTSTFFRSIGGSFGVSLFGAVFSRSMVDDMSARLGPETAEKLARSNERIDLSRLAPDQVAAFLHGVAVSTAEVFAYAVPIAILIPLLGAFIKEIPLRSGPEPDERQGENAPTLVGALD
jgi:MFS family permease